VAVGQTCELRVDALARASTERHHTATHLLHAALKHELGAYVNQAGSEVGPDRLRFDFTHDKKLSPEQLRAIEDAVNAAIMRATPVVAEVQSMQRARDAGFIALFGEKYGDEVRTLAVGDDSKELCGGTHVANAGAIGPFRIVSETAISAGTRRLEAVAGGVALALMRREQDTLAELAKALKTPEDRLVEKVQSLVTEHKQLRKDLDQALAADLTEVLAQFAATATGGDTGRGGVVVAEGLSMKDVQELMTRAQQALAPFAGVVLSPAADGVLVGASVSPPLTDRVKAGDLVSALTRLMGGGGGGRAESAQGKGKDASKLAQAEACARKLLAEAGLG
jgi:alanyl-tRNA synthetase